MYCMIDRVCSYFLPFSFSIAAFFAAASSFCFCLKARSYLR